VTSVLFLPDLHYDRRIWADIPAALGGDYDIAHYDTYAPGGWMSSEAFLADIRQLLPSDASTVVVAALVCQVIGEHIEDLLATAISVLRRMLAR